MRSAILDGSGAVTAQVGGFAAQSGVQSREGVPIACGCTLPLTSPR